MHLDVYERVFGHKFIYYTIYTNRTSKYVDIMSIERKYRNKGEQREREIGGRMSKTGKRINIIGNHDGVSQPETGGQREWDENIYFILTNINHLVI